MKCPRCGAGNREGARFCRECGLLFEATCSSCGAPVQAGSKFCDSCGVPLTPAAPLAIRELSKVAGTAAGAGTPKESADGERRQLTVLFCDLVGSTELAARLDPEVLRDVVRAYQQVCDAVIKRFRGHVAQYLGDGLLVYFGYPVAGEDDPRRAVHAAGGIINELAALNERLRRERDITLAVRIGIHTGPVVVGEIGASARRDALALGQTPNIAARLQVIAEPDTVVISAATHHLLRGTVAVSDLGAQVLKGLQDPLRAYRVEVRKGPMDARETAAAAPLTPLVGRDQEIGLLLERWEHVKDDRGHVVLLGGEPGIGELSSRVVD